jgi:PST family polysaccharide transporter
LSKSTFVSALKWSTASELASKVVQPVIFIILARILTPEDYGVMAAAVMVIHFTQVFWDAGMGKALIQRQTDIAGASNVAFWINVVVAFFFAVILFLSSDLIADKLFHDERVANVLKVMTLQVLLGSFGSIHTALLQKEMHFNRLFWIRVTTVVFPGLISIPLASYDMSYWALVIGTLVGQLLQVILLWRTSKWKPQFAFNWTLAKEMSRFGFWVTVTGLLVWFYLWADSFIVGAYLDARHLGLFRTGNMFVMMIFDILFLPLLPVVYSYFVKVSSDREKITEAFSKIIKIIAIVAIPLSFFLFTIAEPLSNIIFGKKWIGIGFVIGTMSIMRGFGWLVGVNGEGYRAIGKPYYETIIYAFTSVFFLAGYLLSIRLGFISFVKIRLLLGMLALIPHFYLFQRLFKVQLLDILKLTLTITLISCISVLLRLIISPLDLNVYLYLALLTLTSVGLIGSIIFYVEKKFIINFLYEFRVLKTKE